MRCLVILYMHLFMTSSNQIIFKKASHNRYQLSFFIQFWTVHLVQLCCEIHLWNKEKNLSAFSTVQPLQIAIVIPVQKCLGLHVITKVYTCASLLQFYILWTLRSHNCTYIANPWYEIFKGSTWARMSKFDISYLSVDSSGWKKYVLLDKRKSFLWIILTNLSYT